MKKVLYLTLFLLLPYLGANGQQAIVDSLKKELKKSTPTEKPHLLNELAFNFLLIGVLEESLHFAREAKKEAKAHKQSEEEGRALKNIGNVHYYSNQIDKAFEQYYASIDIFKQHEHHEQLIMVYNNLSNLHLQQGDFSKTHEVLSLAAQHAEQHQIINIPLLGALSNFYQLIGSYEKSLEYTLQTLKQAELKKDKEGIALAYNTLAIIYIHDKQLNKGEEAYLSAIKLFKELEQNNHVASTYNNLGSLYSKMAIYDKALEYCNKALELKTKLQHTEGILFSFLAIGDLHSEMKNYALALEFYNNGIALATTSNTSHLLSIFQNKLGILYTRTNKLEAAFQNLMASNKVAIENNSLEYMRSNYQYLAKIDSAKSNYKSALFFHQQFKAVENTLYNQEKNKQLKEIQIRFETEKKDEQIELLNNNLGLEKEKSNLIEKEKEAQRLLKNIAIFATLIAIGLLTLLLNRMKIRKRYFEQREELITAQEKEATLLLDNERLAKKQLLIEQELRETELKREANFNRTRAEKLNLELQHKNRELSSMALATSQKNNLLTAIDKKVKEIEKETSPKIKKELRTIKNLIKDNLTLEEDWTDFKLHFESIHPDFYHKLLSLHSGLSQNDQKLCAYIRINLSSKEIARIMNISPKSVQMSRYRLKKKFKLLPNEDLIQFIEKI